MALVLRPEEELKTGHIRHDPKEMMEAYQVGRDLALRRLPDIRRSMKGR